LLEGFSCRKGISPLQGEASFKRSCPRKHILSVAWHYQVALGGGREASWEAVSSFFSKQMAVYLPRWRRRRRNTAGVCDATATRRARPLPSPDICLRRRHCCLPRIYHRSGCVKTSRRVPAAYRAIFSALRHPRHLSREKQLPSAGGLVPPSQGYPSGDRKTRSGRRQGGKHSMPGPLVGKEGRLKALSGLPLERLARTPISSGELAIFAAACGLLRRERNSCGAACIWPARAENACIGKPHASAALSTASAARARRPLLCGAKSRAFSGESLSSRTIHRWASLQVTRRGGYIRSGAVRGRLAARRLTRLSGAVCLRRRAHSSGPLPSETLHCKSLPSLFSECSFDVAVGGASGTRWAARISPGSASEAGGHSAIFFRRRGWKGWLCRVPCLNAAAGAIARLL